MYFLVNGYSTGHKFSSLHRGKSTLFHGVYYFLKHREPPWHRREDIDSARRRIPKHMLCNHI